MASGALPGEPTEPRPKPVEVVAGRDRGHDARRGRAVDRLDDDVAARLDLGLAEREVDHVHPVGDGGLDPLGDLGTLPSSPTPEMVGIVSTL